MRTDVHVCGVFFDPFTQSYRARVARTDAHARRQANPCSNDPSTPIQPKRGASMFCSLSSLWSRSSYPIWRIKSARLS